MNDPQGSNKDFLVGEAGILTGRSNGDQQPLIPDENTLKV